MVYKLAGILALQTMMSSAVVTLGQVEDFSDGLGGWQEGLPSPNAPGILMTGGPDGSSHLQNISSGVGSAGSSLAMFTRSQQWIGDYTGVPAISLDARNADSSTGTALNLRLGFQGPNGWFVTEPNQVAAGGNWENFTFSLSPDFLTAVGATGTAEQALADVSTFEIFAAPDSLSAGGIVRGARVAADLRIDNITAIPEPTSLGLLALGAMTFLRRRRC